MTGILSASRCAAHYHMEALFKMEPHGCLHHFEYFSHGNSHPGVMPPFASGVVCCQQSELSWWQYSPLVVWFVFPWCFSHCFKTEHFRFAQRKWKCINTHLHLQYIFFIYTLWCKILVRTDGWKRVTASLLMNCRGNKPQAASLRIYFKLFQF